jgi:hypothetical protein
MVTECNRRHRGGYPRAASGRTQRVQGSLAHSPSIVAGMRRILLPVPGCAVVMGGRRAGAAIGQCQQFESLGDLSPDGDNREHVIAQYDQIPLNRRP